MRICREGGMGCGVHPSKRAPESPQRRHFLAALASLPLIAAWPGRKAMSTEAALLHRPIPQGGESLPAIGLGTWQAFDFGADSKARTEAAETLGAFIDAGARVIDSSPMYGKADAAVGD